MAAFTTANSGVNCWKTDLDNIYNDSSNQDLLSPNISLAAVSGLIKLKWAQKFQTDTATNDHSFVEVREVGGANPVKVWEYLGAVMTNAIGTPVVNVGMSAGWGVYRADISSFAGKIIEVRFHLDSGTGTILIRHARPPGSLRHPRRPSSSSEDQPRRTQKVSSVAARCYARRRPPIPQRAVNPGPVLTSRADSS